MKRILSFLLASLMLLPLGACTSSGTPGIADTEGETTSSASDTADTTAAAPETTTAAPETEPPVTYPVKVHPDPSVTRLLAENILRDTTDEGEEDEILTIFDVSAKNYQKLHNTEHTNTAPVSLRWSFNSNSSWELKVPSDLSAYKTLTFSFYADETAIGETFILYFKSENSTTDGMDYYSYKLEVQGAGWNHYSFRLSSMAVNRTPLGWDQINGLYLTSTGWDQSNSPKTVLYLDNIDLHTSTSVELKSNVPQMQDAVAFSLGGARALVGNDIVEISYLDDSSVVTEEDGVLWLPLSPLAAVRDAGADYNAASHVLRMTLDGKAYEFTGEKNTAKIGGKDEKLDFTVRVIGDSLFVPQPYLSELFGFTEMYRDQMGLVILSQKKDLFDLERDLTTLLNISYSTLFTRPSGEEIVLDMYDNLGGEVHPRIMLKADDFDRLADYSREDETYKSFVTSLVAKYGVGTNEYNDAPVKWELTDGVRLLAISREAKNRIIPWAFLYRITGSKTYAARAWKDINALCEFKDWHPEHFLDTAEICYAMAIGYDWLYDYLTEEQRTKMEEATLRMGILPGLDRYEGRASMWGDNNWTGVCNGGLVAAALAMADVYPEECSRLLGYAMLDVEKGMYTYAPDGGYLESPGYWSYGTDYLHVMMSSLDSACGSTYGLYNSPGFAASAYFTAYFESEVGSWGFHDSGSGQIDTNCLSWFAKMSEDPSLNRLRRNSLDSKKKPINVYDLMWYDPENLSDSVELPLDAYYTEVGSVTMRSSWEKGSILLGLHGGANSASHGDLDIGNFFLDAAGQRFFIELGSDNYNIPAYFGASRWNYYKKRAEGQNTLVIGKVSHKLPDQEKNAIGKFSRVESSAGTSLAIVDMASAYTSVKEGQRGILFTDDRSTIIIQDELTLSGNQRIRWSAHTQGKIIINEGGRSAFIQRGSYYLYCEIVSDNKDLVFSAGKAVSFDENYPKTSGEDDRSKINKLMILTPENVSEWNVAVVCRVIAPGEAGPAIGTTYQWQDMADWKAE